MAPKRVALTTLAVTTLGGVVAEQTPAPLIIAESNLQTRLMRLSTRNETQAVS
jgi:hypothetical protein